MLVGIDYELRFSAPFHLGTGIRAGLVDRTVLRDSRGYLYVPASTFKGVLREHCEQLCRLYVPAEDVASPHDTYASLADFGRAPTLLSRIFGSSLNPGTLLFQDAHQTSDASKAYQEHIYKDAQISLMTQVRIDRHTRTAVDEALYTSEFGISDLVFEGSIKGQLNCTPLPALTRTVSSHSEKAYLLTPTCSLLLLLGSLLLVEQLGGNKSTGKGQCHCFITHVRLDGQVCPEKDWRSWIEQLDELSNYQSEQKGGQA
jgi:CRISPR/Cas system CMR subunit Cmr4 (Cas7 group RAMP superfamily)